MTRLHCAARLLARPDRPVSQKDREKTGIRVSFALRILALATTALVASFALAQHSRVSRSEAQQLFAKANSTYQQQQYAEARVLYSEIAEGGVSSPDLFYNMANACARLGKTGEAVVYYERARKLAPRDPEIRTNLRKIAPVDNDPQRFVLIRPFFWVVGYFTMQEWMGLFLTLFAAVGLVGFAFFITAPDSRNHVLLRPFWYVIVAAWLVFTVFTAAKYNEFEYRTYSIVMTQAAPIYSGPDEKFSQVLSAPEGTKVRVVPFDEAPGWNQVVLMDGRKGFMRSDNLIKI